MSLRRQALPAVPEETRRVARAAFPKGTLCPRIADALGPVYQDSQFATLFPRRCLARARELPCDDAEPQRGAWGAAER